MYHAAVFPVMIASPSDVQEERNTIREIIQNWNFSDSQSKRVILQPVSWETHATPDLGARGQELINGQLLDQCDLLVGVFWTRIGTPTGADVSGTVEEIRRHIEAGKPAMVYFSSRPAAPDLLDPEQYAGVKSFKSWCKENGLYWEFSSIDELRDHFSRQLRICLNQNEYMAGLIESEINEFEETSEPRMQSISFPEEAVTLLSAAADANGQILFRQFIGGWTLSAGGREWEDDKSEKRFAKWKSHLRKLEDYGLIEERAFESGVYFVTHEGYEAVERHRKK